MAESVERLLIRIDATTEQLRRELKRAEDAVSHSNGVISRSLDSMGAGWRGASKWVEQHNAQLKFLGAAAVGGVFAATKIVADYSDKFKSLQAQLRLVTSSQSELNSVWDASLAIANDTGVSLDGTVTLYARMARATEELGLNQSDLLGITETINKAFVISGATAQESSAAIIQLSQAMAKGRLDGQELNAVLEQSPRLARLIAEEMRVPIGAMKELGSQGKITSEVMVAAFENGAATIDEEFSQIPVTVGRAMNEVRNQLANAIGRADLEPLTKEIQRFGDVLKDPAVIEGISSMAGAIVKLTTAAAQAVAVLPSLTEFLAEGLANAVGGPAADDMDRLATRITYLKNQLAAYAEYADDKVAPVIRDMREELKKLEAVYELNLELETKRTKTVAKLTEVSVKAKKVSHDLGEATDKAAGAAKRESEATEKLSKSLARLQEVKVKAARAQELYAKTGLQVLINLDEERQLLRMTEREQFIYNKTKEAGAEVSEEVAAAIRKSAGALYDQRKALETAQEATGPWADALQGAVERVDSAFADLWKSAFEGFEDFGENLKQAFLQTLGELAHIAITKPIVVGIAGALGIPGTASAGGIGGGISGAGGLLSSLSGGFSGFGTNVATGLSSIGAGGVVPGLQGFGSIFAPGAQGVTQVGIGAIGAGVSGIAGGLIGNQVYGQTSGIGQLLGGAGGLFIPGIGPVLGAGVGSFLGGYAESLFGGNNNGNNAGRATFTDGRFSAFGSGKSFDQKNVDAVTELANKIAAFAAMLGGSDFDGQLKVGNKHGIQYGGQKFGDDVEAFFQVAFDDVIRGAEGLDDALKNALIGFRGTSDEIVAFSAAMISLREQAQINTVSEAIAQFTAEVPTLYQAYNTQIEGVRKLMVEFDGSAQGAIDLSNALAANKAAAFEFALAIQQIGTALGLIAEEQARYFREAILSEEELRNARILERDTLRNSLSGLTDPQEIENAVKRIHELNRLVFDSLDEGLQKTYAESFATYTEETDRVAQALLGNALDALKLSQEELNQQVAIMLDQAATRQQQAADTQHAAAQRMEQAALTMQQAAARLARNAGLEVTA